MGIMRFPTLADIEAAVRAGWSIDTCDPVDRDEWGLHNRARGQCGVTTLVLHDLFGGDLACAEVSAAGTRQGVHLCLRTFGGLHLDLTREQFDATETIGPPRYLTRPAR